MSSSRSLPSLHCKIELNCLSFSSVGHLATWPRSAANEGIDHRADETVAAGVSPALGASSRVGAAGSEGASEVARPEVMLTPGSCPLGTVALSGLCRNKARNACLPGQKTCRPARSTFAQKDSLGVRILCW